MILATRRLRLEPFDEAHLDGLNAIDSDPEVMRYIGPLETREDTLKAIGRVKARWIKFGYSWWAWLESASGEVIGAGCVQNLRRGGESPDPTCPVELGWRLRRDRWGQGFATEAGVAMADFAFQKLAPDMLYAVCKPENVASSSVMKRLGMAYQGIQTWYEKELATYAVTSTDWRLRRAEL